MTGVPKFPGYVYLGYEQLSVAEYGGWQEHSRYSISEPDLTHFYVEAKYLTRIDIVSAWRGEIGATHSLKAYAYAFFDACTIILLYREATPTELMAGDP